jgi:DNA-binding transcriptional ArsR family regulator
MLVSVTTNQCAPVLRALSDPVRFRIMGLLLTERLSVNEVADRLKLPQYNISRHLRVLREAGLLDSANEGKEHRHVVAAKLNKQLARDECTLDLKCCSFRFDKLPR